MNEPIFRDANGKYFRKLYLEDLQETDIGLGSMYVCWIDFASYIYLSIA